MSSDASRSETDADERPASAADRRAERTDDSSPDRTLPEGFGEPAPDREASRWGGYALAGLLAVVFLVGLVRLTYPTASVMVVGTLLALFGVFVGALAAWTRLRES
mgnify:CR=1 FL=1